MKCRMLTFVPLLCIFGLVGVPAASAQNGMTLLPTADVDSVAVRLAALETELASLRAGTEPGADSGLYKDDAACQADCDASGGSYAGFAFIWVKPHFKEAFQATSYSLSTDTMNLAGYDYDYGITPRVWLGYESSDGLGIRATYWQYDHSGADVSLISDADTIVGAQTITVSVPAIIQSAAPGDELIASSSLETQTLDIEGTMRLVLGETTAVAGAGLHYGRMLQDNRAVISAGGVPQSMLNRRRQLEGLGPTLSADMLRPVGGGLAMAAGLRGSLLFGDKSIERFATGALPGSISMDADDFTFQTDISVGLQWSRPTALGEVALRGAYEGSFWIDAGEPVLTLLGFEGFALSLIVSR